MQPPIEPLRRVRAALLETGAFTGMCLVCVGVLFARAPTPFVTPGIYAEEGRYFFADAYNRGWESLLFLWNGYFVLVPRLVANLALSLHVPMRMVPELFVYACLPLYGVVWWAIWSLPKPTKTRGLLIVASVLVPIGNEIFMNLTCLQWLMPLLSVAIYCGETPRSGLRAGTSSLAFAASLLTGPYAVVLAPVFLGDAFVRGQVREKRLLLLISLIAMAATLGGLARFGSIRRTAVSATPALFDFLQLAFRTYFFPVLGPTVDDAPVQVVVVGALATPALLIWIASRVLRHGDQLASVSLVLSPLFFATTLISYASDPSALSPYTSAIRTFYLPMVFLFWALIASAPLDRWSQTVFAVLSVWLAVQVPAIAERPLPYDRAAVAAWDGYATLLEDGGVGRIPISPPGWDLVVEVPRRL